MEVIPHTRNKKCIRLTEAGRVFGNSFILPIDHAEHRTLAKFPEQDHIMSISLLKSTLYPSYATL